MHIYIILLEIIYIYIFYFILPIYFYILKHISL